MVFDKYSSKNLIWKKRIYGIVAYTGDDTKIMSNPKRSMNKGSLFDRLAVKFFLVGFAIILIFAAVI